MTCYEESPEELAYLAGAAAFKEAQDFDDCSSLATDCKIQHFDWNDLEVGKLLGLGCFSAVREVTLKQDNNKNNKCYAVKTLRRDKMSQAFHIGATDLVLEGKILRNLDHENVIRLHGVSGVYLWDSYSKITGYFLILERLYGTLDQSLVKWRRFYQKQALGKYRHDSCLVRRRKTIALGIARGMSYLHSNHVVYRDLKPHNIGFDREGNVKIFDFGLARDLDPHCYESVTYRGGRRLTARVGSPRYMAPENLLGQPYGLSADVYSFAILLWEVLTLKIAYDNVTVDQVETKIALGNLRPSLKRTGGAISAQVKKLLKASWHGDPQCRPKLKSICALLEADLDQTLDEESSLDTTMSKLTRKVSESFIKSKSKTASADTKRNKINFGKRFLKACAA